MKILVYALFASLLFFTPAFTLAGSEEELLNEAVSDTQKMMKDSQKRQNLLQDQKAKDADKAASAVVGSENMNEIYGISADILPRLMKEQGSPEKAAAYLEAIQRNPAEFLQNLPPEIQEKIKGLSSKVEKRDGKKLNSTSP